VFRQAVVLGVASLSLFSNRAGPGGCGGEDASSGGVNAPCTRNYDCATGLTCDNGLCAGPNEDSGGASDAGGGGKDAAASD
jgi:hypothetical protein